MAIAWLSACSSSKSVDPHGAAGAAGSTADASAGADTSSAGSSSSSGGSAGEGLVEAGGASNAGARNGASGASGGSGSSDSSSGDVGGALNLFIDQVVLSQGGGSPRCLPRPLPAGPPGTANDGRVACLIAELEPGSCDCSQTARAPLPASVLTATRRQLQAIGVCGGSGTVSCDTFCGCEIDQASGVASEPGSPLHACQNDLAVPNNVDGFCVIDQGRTDAGGAPAPLGNPAIVAECPANEKRLLRFVGAGQPASGATTFIGCTGTPLTP